MITSPDVFNDALSPADAIVQLVTVAFGEFGLQQAILDDEEGTLTLWMRTANQAVCATAMLEMIMHQLDAEAYDFVDTDGANVVVRLFQ